jgi:hypothetical protein
MVNGQWWKFDYFVAVVGLIGQQPKLAVLQSIAELYYFNASHVGQKTNMGFRWLSDLVNSGLVNGCMVNGGLVNCQWWMVKIRSSCWFLTITLIHLVHYQLSIANSQLTIHHSPLSSSTLSVFSYQLSIIQLSIYHSPFSKGCCEAAR